MVFQLPLWTFLLSCGATTPVAEEEKPSEPQELKRFETIGRIASVNEADGFVLIQQFQEISLPAGTTLTSYGESGERTNLRLSGERMGLFTVADLRAGTARVGDTVQLLRSEQEAPDPFEGTIKIKPKKPPLEASVEAPSA